MPERTIPKPPAGLAATGRALWRSMHEALPSDGEFDERELAILGLACRQADDVAALERALKKSGAVVRGSQGQPRLAQALSEARQGRLAVARLLGAIELPDLAGAERTTAGVRGQRAAIARWARRDQLAAQRERRANRA